MHKLKMLSALFICFFICACAAETPPSETTLPPETTQPVDTTAPFIETEPSDTTPPTTEPAIRHPFQDELDATGFVCFGDPYYQTSDGTVHFSSATYRYTGSSDRINLACLGLTLQLPQEWLGRVEVIQTTGFVYITNRSVIDGNIDLAKKLYPDVDVGEMYGWQDYMLRIFRIEKDSYFEGDPRNPEVEVYLGETATHYYYLMTPEAQYEVSEQRQWRTILIHHIGEDAYFELVGNLVVTPDMVRDMITIHDAVQPE